MKTTLVILAALVPWLGGCVSTAPNWESTFGDAARQARATQVIDRQAPSRNTGLAATDGKAVAGAMKGYADSYGYAVKEAKPPTLSIGTTGSK
jgi:hypothetical protein